MLSKYDRFTRQFKIRGELEYFFVFFLFLFCLFVCFFFAEERITLEENCFYYLSQR